jgi:predicted P-loop ATPase
MTETAPTTRRARKHPPRGDTQTKPVDDHDEARRFIAAQLETSKEGYVRPTIANLTRVLGTDPAWLGILSWDEFRDGIRRRKASPCLPHERPPAHAAGTWTDEDTTRTASWCGYVYGATFTPEMVERAVVVVARRNPSHEVREWLSALRHDGVRRVSTFASKYLGAESSPYVHRVGEILLLSAVARVMRPGCKVDTVAVLEGVQGTRKSSAVRALFAPWSSDSAIEIGNKDAYQLLRGAWGIEFAEVDKYRGRDAAVLKSFISSPTDRYRPSYARRTVDVPRQCVFVGSTNEVEYLGDSTGGRRWLPIRVGRIDLEAVERDRDQLFAEAFQRYSAGETWHPDTADLVRDATQEQAERAMLDPWMQPIEAWVMSLANRAKSTEPGWTTSEVLLHALDKNVSAMTKSDQMRVGAILRELGLSLGRPRTEIPSSRVRRYRLDRLDQSAKGAGALSYSGPASGPTSGEVGEEVGPA